LTARALVTLLGGLELGLMPCKTYQADLTLFEAFAG
jgi:hypothetical protein